jgi:hypothetical protein
MAKENIVFGIDIETGKAAQSFSGIKTELKALTKAIGEIDPNSNAFEVATKRAGQLRDQIRGVNDAIENADPEKKFAPFSRTVQGLAGGFAAAQGAMALFGGESEELEKTLVKVQGAMALSQGLNSLLAFKNDFKALGILIINQVVKAFTTLRGALIATGIGALVVTLGTLIANWKEFSKAITDAFPGFKVVTDFFSNIKQIGVGTLKGLVEGFKVVGDVIAKLFEGDFSGAIDSAKEFGERVAVAYNEGYAEEDRKIKIENGLKDRKFALDLEEAKGKDVRAKRIQLMKDELSILEKGSEEYNAKLIEIETLRTEIRKEAAEKEKERLAKIAEEEKKAFEKSVERAKEQYDTYKNNLTKELDALKKYLDEKNKKMDEDDKKRQELHDKGLRFATDEQNSFADRLEALKAYLEAGYITQKEYADAEAKLDRDKAQKKVEALQMTSAALIGYSQVLGQETEAGKALAAAAATIDTYLAASSVFTNVTQNPYMKLLPDGGLTVAIGAAAAAVVGGLARVKAIYAVKVPGGSGGGGGAGAAPSVPQFNPAVAQQVQGGGDVQLGMKPQKVYVVESDIRGTMNKVDVIEANATIG